MNINEEIFRRYGADKKKQIVNNATEQELLSVEPATVERIIKEVGTGGYRSRDKELRIGGNNRRGNHWNSTFEEVGTHRKKLYVSLYVQYGNTDTSISEDYKTFFSSGDYTGSIRYEDRNGNPQTDYLTYTRSQKAEAMRSILLEYIYRKYYKE